MANDSAAISTVYLMKPVLVLRHVAHEGLGTIADALALRRIAYNVVEMFANPPRNFDPREAGGLIVMGGPMNVDETDRYPFLADEVRWLRQAIDAELPVLGICLGAQLLAKALGSRVFANQVKEIGWYDVELLPEAADDRLFCKVASPVTVFHWHGDTFDLPAGAVYLARSSQCTNQAFRFGRSAYGLQFHLEMTAAMIEDWLGEENNCGELAGLDYIDPLAIRRQTPERLLGMQKLAQQVFQRFAELCQPDT
jgi:GMP synthase (glutamine-hydrolysing)